MKTFYSIFRHTALCQPHRCVLALTLLLLCGAFNASGAPASGIPVRMKTPGGEEIWVRAVGDENCRHFETLDGEIVSWLPQVRQSLAPVPQGKRLFPYLLKQRPEVSALPSGGEAASPLRVETESGERPARFLVVLVDFPDRPFSVDLPYEKFNELMNGENYTEGGTCGSARRYFQDNSAGQFNPCFDVVGPVRMANNARYYASVGLDDSPATKMVIEACSYLENELDFSDYDLDGDGVCDNVYFFFAGKGQADGGGTSTIWPHSATLSAFGKTLTVDNVKIENYACSPEQNGRGQFTGIGTFCHEFCHVLGLPDLYYNGSFHPGPYSLMASGNYNNNGYTPPALSCFERLSLGWITPEEIREDGILEIKPLHLSNSARKVTSANPDEYYLFENRRQEGWDAYLPGHGMLAWHIEYDPQAWEDNLVNTSKRRLVDLVRADGPYSSGTALPFPGSADVTAFDFTTSPSFSTNSGASMGVSLSSIEETPEGNITLRASVSGASVAPIVPDTPSVHPVALYNISGHLLLSNPSPSQLSSLPPGLYILRNADGSASKLLIP